MDTIKYNRILLKLSGESLMDQNDCICSPKLSHYISQIKEITDLGVETAIVIGGGNIFRGVNQNLPEIDRLTGDYMGMMATVINALALQSALLMQNINAIVMTAIRMEPVARFYNRHDCIRQLKNKQVVIFAGGTGNPLFTTDTAAALRATEINAQLLLKGTRVDGVYSADPEKYNDAVKYDRLTFNECYEKNLKIMDLTAFTLCKDNNLPVIVFNINSSGVLKSIVTGHKAGTLIQTK